MCLHSDAISRSPGGQAVTIPFDAATKVLGFHGRGLTILVGFFGVHYGAILWGRRPLDKNLVRVQGLGRYRGVNIMI